MCSLFIGPVISKCDRTSTSLTVDGILNIGVDIMGEVIKEWYLEYDIQVNRAGLLGDISSLLGILGINIITINGVDQVADYL